MKGKEILLIVMSSFFLTVIWVASNVYHAYATSTIEPYLQLQITPIAPTFDAQTVESLRSRIEIEPEFQTTPLVIIPSDDELLTEPAPPDLEEEPTLTQIPPAPDVEESVIDLPSPTLTP